MSQYSSLRENKWVVGFAAAVGAVALVILIVFLALRLLPIHQVAMFSALALLHLGTALILVPSMIAKLLKKHNFDSTQRLGYRILGVVVIIMGWVQAWNLMHSSLTL